jgi:hypothetical protein
MSILIRQQAQELLDKVGLNDLHVAVQDKVLTLVGPCGQPLLPISGIAFDTNAPRKAEIPYAIELFTKFLDTHAPKILEYVETKKATPQTPPSYEGTFATVQDYSKNKVVYIRRNPSVDLQYNVVSNEMYISTHTNDDYPLDNLVAAVETLRKEAEPYKLAYTEYMANQKKLSAMKNSLTTCNI